MMKNRYLLPLVIIMFTMLLASCSTPQTITTQEPTIDTNALRTEVAQTIEAESTLNTALTLAAEPSATVEIATPTKAASPTLSAETNTPLPAMPEPTATTVVNVVYPTFTPTYYPDRAELVSMSPVLGKSFRPGSYFDLVFTLKNTGDLDWTTSYRLEYLSGVKPSNHSGTTYDVVKLAAKVAKGKTVDITLDMIAPSAAGHYTSTWAFVNSEGTTFYTVSYGFDVKNP